MRKFQWDGEKIKETVTEKQEKHTPKDILNGIDNTRSEINKFENSILQLEGQMKQVKINLAKAQAFEKNLREFEPKCVELQKTKILEIIGKIRAECEAKATESSKKTIEESPEAYIEEQKKNLPFLDYQKLLATDEKMADKISNRMIRIHLYEKPIFDNPFKG